MCGSSLPEVKSLPDSPVLLWTRHGAMLPVSVVPQPFSPICRQFTLLPQFITFSFNTFVFVTDFYVCVHVLNLGRNVFEHLARLAWVLFILAGTCTPAPG